jgi:hypothetical protein
MEGGEEMLTYLRELGCVFGADMTEAPAFRGDLEALPYASMCGALRNFKTLAAAVLGTFLPCLDYTHVHGCPQVDVEGGPSHRVCTQPGYSEVCVSTWIPRGLVISCWRTRQGRLPFI